MPFPLAVGGSLAHLAMPSIARSISWWAGMAVLAVVAVWMAGSGVVIGAGVAWNSIDEGHIAAALGSLGLGCAGALAIGVLTVRSRRAGVATGDALMKALFIGALVSMPALVLLGPTLVI